MIDVTIIENDEGNITFFEFKNHADYDVFGKDIVCAAVSALFQTVAFFLEGKDECKVTISEALCCMIFDKENANINSKITRCLEFGVNEIQQQYQDNIKIRRIKQK